MATVLPPTGSLGTPGPGWDVGNSSLIRRRAVFCSAVLVVAFFGLLARLYYLQVVKGHEFTERAQRNRLTRISIPAPRGLITDRNGIPLATSKARHNVSVLPALLPSARREKAERAQVLSTLAFLINSTPDEIEKQIIEARQMRARPVDPIVIAEDVDLATITRIEEHRARLKGAISVSEELSRSYPEGHLAAHVLGYSGLVNQEDLEAAQSKGRKLLFDDIIGKSGLERKYDSLLQGQRGALIWEVDAQNRPVRERKSEAAAPGATLQLTLDAKLQRAAEHALSQARNTGAVAAIDPRNGEVLALASNPTFDPNIFSLPRKRFKSEYQKIVRRAGHPLLNRAVASRFPPGSTFKPISAVAGLEHGISPHSAVNCPGYYQFGRRFGCWSTHGGGIDLMDAMAGSCNVYFYNLSLKLGNPESSGPTILAETARRFGLGSKTGIDLPSESAGLMPDPQWRKEYHSKRPELAKWLPGFTLNMSIGQGDVLATPLQMALATSAIANGGTIHQPHLLKSAKDAKGKLVEAPKLASRSVNTSERTLSLVRQGMREVVTRGTGKSSGLPHVAVAGKTGSAEDFHNVLPHSWWVCFAPYDKPTIAIAVIIENSGHGSENALPVAREILEARFPAPKKELAQ